MPYDPGLAARLAAIVEDRPGFTLKDVRNRLAARREDVRRRLQGLAPHRVGENAAIGLFCEPHVKPMDIPGRAMKGWAMIAPEGVADDGDVRRDIELAIDFVPTLPAKV